MHRFSRENTYAKVNFLNLMFKALNLLHNRFATWLEHRSTPSCCLCYLSLYYPCSVTAPVGASVKRVLNEKPKHSESLPIAGRDSLVRKCLSALKGSARWQ